MAKTKRLSTINEVPVADERVLRGPDKRRPTKKHSPEVLKSRHRKSQRMAVVFNHAKNRNLPKTTLNDPVVVPDASENMDEEDEVPLVRTKKHKPTDGFHIRLRKPVSVPDPVPQLEPHSTPQHHSQSEPQLSHSQPYQYQLQPQSQPIQNPHPSQESSPPIPQRNHSIPQRNQTQSQPNRSSSFSAMPQPIPHPRNQPHSQTNSQPLQGPPPPSFREFNQSLSPQPQVDSPVQQMEQGTPDTNPAEADPNAQPDRAKSIRVKIGDDIEEENRYRRGLVNGLKLEMHCHTIGCKIKVDKDSGRNSPANKNVRSLLTHDIGAYIKDRMPMLAPTFARLPKKYRDNMTNHLALHFELPSNETWLWDFIWRKAARRYSNWKSHCHSFYKEEKGAIPVEFLWRPEQWEWLGGHFSDPKFIAKSIHCQNIRKKQNRLQHHLGKTTMADRAKKFARENHPAPHIAAFEEAYSADVNGAALVDQVKEKLQQLLDDRSIDDPGSVDVQVPDEDQFSIINAVLNEYKGTDATTSRTRRNRIGPTVADLRAELERTTAEAKAKEEEYKAREAESKAALEDVKARLKAIEDMMRGTLGVPTGGIAAASDGASYIPSNMINNR